MIVQYTLAKVYTSRQWSLTFKFGGHYGNNQSSSQNYWLFIYVTCTYCNATIHYQFMNYYNQVNVLEWTSISKIYFYNASGILGPWAYIISPSIYSSVFFVDLPCTCTFDNYMNIHVYYVHVNLVTNLHDMGSLLAWDIITRARI